ncbi:Rap1a/Tai family immunity protein [Roseicella aquatilis]|uniref:Rap1a immunity protein domain-containing protein n=1 Tax=Roseicella aquatilis TaxID=2527868 RepID=A0A4R4DVN9_9PROT|nr:Rap1a/Tai family immunity protein [Roseicella aquatilis]TCZ66635.1 hypothetical protein EXY23_00525 [Roseicella aquatilis]
MRKHLAAGAIAALLALPAAAEVTEQNFRGGTTADLATLCGSTRQDRLHTAAVNWCHGFLVGSGQYHRSVSGSGAPMRELFCLPDPSPTLEQAREAFVAWAAAHPQHGSERAVDGLTRFAVETYPCPRGAARAKR